ncbi:spore germination protein [Neobacillus bataviensis]|uniref:spore germination protein n=1 Tax=Neobacillus bataviensis TaxID=220685 RepID=UPI001CC11E16|nr:spore germination protein [Neobacillus bataviensis]
MDFNKDGISIGTISGGIVNFGGAVYISPISVTKTVSGSGSQNSGGSSTSTLAQNASIQSNLSDLIEILRRSLE